MTTKLTKNTVNTVHIVQSWGSKRMKSYFEIFGFKIAVFKPWPGVEIAN